MKDLNTTPLTSILLMAIMTLSAATLPVFTDDVQEEVEELVTTTNQGQLTSDRLSELLETSKNQVETIFNRLEEEGASVPDDTREKFEEGLSLTDDYVILRDQEAFEEANEKAIDAMEKFEEALKILDNESPFEPSETEGEAAKTIRLENAIMRAYYFADKINALASKAQEQGYYDPTISGNVEDAKTHLETAKVYLASGEIDEAAREKAKARGILGRTMGKIHKLSKGIKGKRTENFLKQTEKRLSKLEEKNDKILRDVPLDAKDEVIDALHQARNRIEEIKGKIAIDAVDEAIEDLEEIKYDLKHVQKLINDIKREYRRSLRR